MNAPFRLATDMDVSSYTDLLRRTYQKSYVSKELGLTKECFSKEIFSTPDTQKYLLSNLQITDNQKSWMAFIDEKLIGSITIQRKGKECELRGFYVASEYQGQGIGKKLFKLAMDFSKDDDIILGIYAHNTRSIETYKKWGFVIDQERGTVTTHWPEWPEGIKINSLFMRRSSKHDPSPRY